MAKRKRLRKQPRLQRVEAVGAASLPKVVVPPTAKKRKRRNRQRFNFPTELIKSVVLSPRWMSLGLATVTIFVLFLIGRDEMFFLNEMSVQGNHSISSSEIIANSGLSGAHIFSANPGMAADRISQIPGVISATVTLEWPNKVSISLSEESPVALWIQNGQFFWITEVGELVPARGSSPGLLQIESEVEQPLGDELFVPEDVLSGALHLRELRPNIDHLYYRVGNGLSYQDGRGWRAYFGSGPDMEQKLIVYETIVDDLLGRSITPGYVNVRKAMKPFYSTNNSLAINES